MRALRIVFLLLLGGFGAAPVGAQESPPCPWPGPAAFLTSRVSPPDSVTVRIAESRIKLCYSRPSARGRVVMGELLRYGRPWRTGANEPTLLFLPVAAELGGVALEPGRYLLISIPEPTAWTLVFHSSEGSTPREIFTDTVERGRAVVAVERTDEHVETFTVYGIDGRDRGELVLEWEHTRVRLPIELR